MNPALPAGQLSFLGYSKKLIDALLLIGPVALALALLGPCEYLGIAWAFVAARTCKVLWLSVLLNRRFAGVFGPDPARFLVRVGLSTSAAWACAWLLLDLENSASLIPTAIFDLALPTVGGILAFAAGSYLRIDEFRAVWALLLHKVYGYGYEQDLNTLGSVALYFLVFLAVWPQFERVRLRQTLALVLAAFYAVVAARY